MEYDIERVKSGARQRALLWQTDKLYGKAVSDAVIVYEDLYHLGLFDEAASEVMRVKRNERILSEERDKLVGIIQNCSPEEAYQRYENIQERVTDHHNEIVRKR